MHDSSISDTRTTTGGWLEQGTALPFALYTVTGFVGLLAEQGFERYVSLLVGATAAASAAVIFAYFLGFAIGSAVTGALLKRGYLRRPLLIYASLELIIGISGVVFAYLFHDITAQLAQWQPVDAGPVATFFVRFSFATLLVLPTATFMGASFPLIADVIDRQGSSGGRQWTFAYAANLIGAAAAALFAPYLIIPYIGVRGSFWVCFALTSIVFLAVIVRKGAPAGGKQEGATPDAGKIRLDHRAWLLLGASFASGAVFFASEVIWTHLIGVVVGSSIYAFSSMLLMVLLGLLIGALRIGRSLNRVVYHSLFLACAIAVLIQFRLWDLAQIAFALPPMKIFQNFFVVEAYKLLVAGVLIVPSAALLGAVFPSLLSSPALVGPDATCGVGYVSTANSLGCLTGALLGVFVMIPKLGSENSLKVIVVALIVVSLLFLWQARPTSTEWVRVGALSLICLSLAYYWRWDRRLLTAGLNVYLGTSIGSTDSSDNAKDVSAQMIFFHEGAQGGMTTVIESSFTRNDRVDKIRTLLTNGKFQGNDVRSGEGEAQVGLSLIPTLFVKNVDRALLVGLGTGHTALALKELHYKQIDVAEYAPGIVEAASSAFSHLNENVMQDPSLRLSIEDGRNMLLVDSTRMYDLITIEVNSIWFAGATNVYSREFYDLAKKRIRPGGVLQQWVQMHHISPVEIASAMSTVRSVFPYVSFWYFGGQGMMVATLEPQIRDDDRTAALMRLLPAYQGSIWESRLMAPPEVERMLDYLRPVINTDHNRWIEYATPRYNSSDYDWKAHNTKFFKNFGMGQSAAQENIRR